MQPRGDLQVSADVKEALLDELREQVDPVDLPVVLGDQPRFMRVKGFYGKEEIFRVLVLFEPQRRLSQDPGREEILFPFPVMYVGDTLPDKAFEIARLLFVSTDNSRQFTNFFRQPVINLLIGETRPRACGVILLAPQENPLVKAPAEVL